jgi:hypothetical protein
MSSHLIHLDECLPGLAKQVEFARTYAKIDPHSSLNKTRSVLEKLLADVHATSIGPIGRPASLMELIANTQLSKLIPSRIRARMQGIQALGNLGSHLGDVTASDAQRGLEDLREIIDWYLTLRSPRADEKSLAREDASGEAIRSTTNADRPDRSFDSYDPKATVQIIEALVSRHSMKQAQFKQLHHLPQTATIHGHLRYCRVTERFTGSGGNATTALRLRACLEALQGGASWTNAIAIAREALPTVA